MSIAQKFWDFIEIIIRFFLERLFHLKESHIQAFLQFVKFGIVGVSNTLISYVSYVISLKLFEQIGVLPRIDYLVAQAIAFFIGLLWSYFWNNRFVFTKKEGESRNSWSTFFKMFISYASTSLILNSILAYIWVEVVGISKLIAPIINLLVSVPLNFIINKFWAFRTKK